MNVEKHTIYGKTKIKNLLNAYLANYPNTTFDYRVFALTNTKMHGLVGVLINVNKHETVCILSKLKDIVELQSECRLNIPKLEVSGGDINIYNSGYGSGKSFRLDAIKDRTIESFDKLEIITIESDFSRILREIKKSEHK